MSIKAKPMKFKHILLGIMVIVTLTALNPYDIAFVYSSKHHTTKSQDDQGGHRA